MVRTNNVRKITKFKRSIKAISPVIATLLMIAIAVVASLVVYAWVSGYMGFQTDKAGQAIALPSLAAGDVSDPVNNLGDLVVYVQNVGQGTVEVSAVYVDDVLIADAALSYIPNPPGKVISEGNTVEITIDGAFELDERHDIKVTTTSGTSMTLSNVKPGTGSGTTTPASAAITLSPSGGPSGTTVTVSGTGFTATSAITIRFNSVVMTTTPGTVTSSGTGTFSCEFTVPTSSNGPYTVSATDGSSKTDSDTFTVAAVVVPTITLNPTTGPTGTEVIVSGTGFAASTGLSATFDGSSVTLSGTTSTDSSGEFTNARFTVPASATAGAKTVTFTAATTSDSDSFTVLVPEITLDPTSGNAGSTVSVSGTGFMPSTALTATFAGSAVTLSVASTDSSGAFTDAEFTVPVSATSGAKTVIITAGTTSDSDTFTVNPSLPAIYVTTNSAFHFPTSEGSLTNFANMQNVAVSYATLTEEDTDNNNGDFGPSHNSGDGTYTTISANNAGGQQVTADGSGHITSVTFRGRGASATVNVKIIITDSSGNIIPNGISNSVSCTTSDSDRTADFANDPIVQNNQLYWILVVPDGNFRLMIDASTGGISKYDSSNSYSTPQNTGTVTSGTIEYQRLRANINYDNYRLDQEVQFSGVTAFGSYHHLEIKAGSLDAEGLRVDYWRTSDSTWQAVGTLTGTDNTFDITLTTTTLDLRFVDTTVSADALLSTWQIDYVRLVA